MVRKPGNSSSRAIFMPARTRKHPPKCSCHGDRDGHFRLFHRFFQGGDVDPAHRHHRLEGAFGLVPVGSRRQVEEKFRRDLPGMPPAVLAPAAGAFLSAIADDGVPEAVGLFLIFCDHHEGDGLVRREVGAAIQADELAPEYGELDGQFVAFPAAGIIGGGGVHAIDMAVGKSGGIERGRFPGFAVIVPEAIDDIGHDVSPCVCCGGFAASGRRRDAGYSKKPFGVVP